VFVFSLLSSLTCQRAVPPPVLIRPAANDKPSRRIHTLLAVDMLRVGNQRLAIQIQRE
jgi:hypothetical protein